MKIYIAEKIQSFKNGSTLLFHGTDANFEIDEYHGKHYGFHFGDVRTAWNFATSGVNANYRRHSEMGDIPALDYGPQLIIANLDGNFMDFADLEVWGIGDFKKLFNEELPKIFNDPSLGWDKSLGIYGNLNRIEIKKLLNADNPNADIDGLRYYNEYDSNSLGVRDKVAIETYLKRRGVPESYINTALNNKSTMSFLVINKSVINELYVDTKDMYQK